MTKRGERKSFYPKNELLDADFKQRQLENALLSYCMDLEYKARIKHAKRKKRK